MKIYDIIAKKRDGFKLTKTEIEFVINKYTSNKIPDYQMSALLMAMYLKGLDDQEITDLTLAMAESGDMIDLSEIPGIKVDKHSTGGVGDKTTLIIAPIVAACGVSVAKMSGRGLGYTGGTIDKLESIPGFKTQISQEDFINIVNKIGACVVGQSGILAPADKKIYALRDVTATVESIGLIAASIMSKKIASGCDAILLDVKVGDGAFMKTYDDAVKLANKMVSIGKMVNRNVRAIITDMNQPLGNAIGNSLEVIEAIKTLKNQGPKDLTELCICLASNMIYLAKKQSLADCEKQVRDVLKSGKAFDKFIEIVKAQGGDESYIRDVSKFNKAKFSYNIIAERSGYISNINAQLCGAASMVLGAGRATKEDSIDYASGIILKAKTGDFVKKGDILAVLFTFEQEKINQAQDLVSSAISFLDTKPTKNKLIYNII
ncbi:MAG: pyrimidine-nucleoside phosphorylase [Oscillospiraceae bacterium]|nr:pyrimidine-nucleoside phosphorylase [Oscillospiraceae bacterium]